MTKEKKYFDSNQLDIVNQAVSISEDVVNDRFNMTLSTWKKYRYDIRTHKDLRDHEKAPNVFAQIIRYSRPAPPNGLRERDFYSICIQDHNILQALKRETELTLRPLLIYVLSHELVHIIRFYRFLQNFDADEKSRTIEEARVHHITYEMLKAIKLDDLPIILNYYSKHREMVY
ncbi:MAG: hypothetical protein JRG97_14790 [Deltaproteobacteria bacterium]|nr:hypothetical protein [Deltaproteobacteria bacterium]MBW2053139.1 hypothetical protein [Deltaproteobacteria bacterium]MBW2142308.1 hypothetical protein [Deltaproteobacteria bacterium]MBW2324313.1 hypothetical protein [Deltaproteobacteria bacterium]